MTFDRSTAKSIIENYFDNHFSDIKRTIVFPKDKGKVYELYCITRLLEWIQERYNVRISYVGDTKMKFKFGGGSVNRQDYSYFEIYGIDSSEKIELHTDIEVKTLGSHISENNLGGGRRTSQDLSFMHEIDIVLIKKDVKCNEMPNHDQVLLGIECKAYTNFRKGVIREVLGVRRELSYFDQGLIAELDEILKPSDPPIRVNSNPRSLYWLACTDYSSRNYENSPKEFGVEIKIWIPKVSN